MHSQKAPPSSTGPATAAVTGHALSVFLHCFTAIGPSLLLPRIAPKINFLHTHLCIRFCFEGTLGKESWHPRAALQGGILELGHLARCGEDPGGGLRGRTTSGILGITGIKTVTCGGLGCGVGGR